MSKVSIIVPVYNASNRIEKCLDSLVNQTIQDIEIIIINDGSTDDSESIINKYIKKYPNIIKYYSKENEGVAITRNFGIERATSKYILFVDADDYIDLQLVEKLNQYIEEDIDLIKFKLQKLDINLNVIEKIDGPVFDKTLGEDAFNRLYSKDVLIDSPCVYLMKKQLFTENNLKFNRRYHEDFGLIPLIIVKAKTFISIPDYLYQYIQGQDSLMRNDDYSKTIQKMEDILYHYDNAIKEVHNMKLNRITEENLKIYYTNSVILKLNSLKKEDKDKYIKEIRKRKMYKNIKVRNVKQLIKRLLLMVNIKLYLKIR